MANPVLDKNGLTYLWGKIVEKLNKKADKTNVVPKTGGSFTGDVAFTGEILGQQITATHLVSTAASNLTTKSDKIAVFDSNNFIRYRSPAQLSEDLGVSSNGGFEASTTTFSTNSAGNKVITQTFSDRTLVSTISTLANGNKKIVETLTKSGATTTKTTIIDKTTGTITESVS